MRGGGRDRRKELVNIPVDQKRSGYEVTNNPRPEIDPVIAAKLTLLGLIHVIQLKVPKKDMIASGNTK